MQRDQLIGKAVGWLRFGQIQAVLFLEVDGIVQIRPETKTRSVRAFRFGGGGGEAVLPVRGKLVVEVQVSRHGADGRERRVGVGFRDGRVVRVGQVRAGRAGRRRRVLSQLLPDDHQVVVLLQDLPGNVAGVVVHVLRAVRTHLRPVGVVQGPVVET